eukprot:6208677-Pleurochrysis_carterae.AAC.1
MSLTAEGVILLTPGPVRMPTLPPTHLYTTTHNHTHTQPHAHTTSRRYNHTHTSTLTQNHTHTRTHTSTHTQVRAHTRAHKHTSTHTQAHKHTHARGCAFLQLTAWSHYYPALQPSAQPRRPSPLVLPGVDEITAIRTCSQSSFLLSHPYSSIHSSAVNAPLAASIGQRRWAKKMLSFTFPPIEIEYVVKKPREPLLERKYSHKPSCDVTKAATSEIFPPHGVFLCYRATTTFCMEGVCRSATLSRSTLGLIAQTKLCPRKHRENYVP